MALAPHPAEELKKGHGKSPSPSKQKGTPNDNARKPSKKSTDGGDAVVYKSASSESSSGNPAPPASASIEGAEGGFRMVTSPLEVNLADGQYTLTLYAVDLAGNAATTGEINIGVGSGSFPPAPVPPPPPPEPKERKKENDGSKSCRADAIAVMVAVMATFYFGG